MPEWQSATIAHNAKKIHEAIRGKTLRRKIVSSFAKKYQLLYFSSVSQGKDAIPVVRGSMTSADQVDTNIAIGAHAGYDIMFVERLASVSFQGYSSSIHRWYVLQIDLKNAHNMPFVFLGTKQQSKAYYARLLSTKRELSYLSLDTSAHHSAAFHGQYVLLASPAELPRMHDIFTDEMIDMIAEKHYPFAIEIENDSLILLTEAVLPSEQLLTKMLHYGLWLAKHIDTEVA